MNLTYYGDKMEIKGKFGVEICDCDGHLVKKIEYHNTVTKLGIRQIKRWLDRNETVNQHPRGPRPFGDHIVCAGDMARIAVADGMEILRDDESGDTPDYPIMNMFDTNEGTRYQFWNSRDGWRSRVIRLKKEINLKGFSFLRNYDSNSTWHGHNVANVAIRTVGCSVSGAGSSEYNSTEYSRSRTDYNNHRYYKKYHEDYYIYADSTESKWVMSSSLGGDAAYETSDQTFPANPWEGTWVVVNGTANPPVVTYGNSSYRRPYICLADEELNTSDQDSSRQMSFTFRDHQVDDWDKTSERYMGKYPYAMRTFESVRDLYHEDGYMHPQWYGYIPDVQDIAISLYCNDNGDYTHYWMEMDIYEAVPHPQNPYALKLGTDDGTILPLDSTNEGLGAFAAGMEWKCDSVDQTTGFTVRYSRNLLPEEANNITFKEIGLFMNADGHLPYAMSEPLLENANELFARAIFDDPWSKTEDQTATIYYEITVN